MKTIIFLHHLRFSLYFKIHDCLGLIFFFRASVCCSKQIYFATKKRCLFSVPSSALRSENIYNKLLSGAKFVLMVSCKTEALVIITTFNCQT